MKPLIIVLLMVIWATQALGAPASERLILLDLRQCENPWAENSLASKLQTVLTREPGWRVEPITVSGDANERGGSWLSIDSAVTIGQERGAQYLVTLVVSEQRLERRKSFHVPLVFHKWETVALMTGEYRIIDLIRGKQVKAEPFACEIRGPRTFQATMDDTKFDPDITLTATEKTLIFDQLENELLAKLIPKMKPAFAKGDRDSYARQETKKRP